MTSNRLDELRRIGEMADDLFREGRPRDALQNYRRVLAEFDENGHIDSYIMAKITLGSLHCHIKLGEFKQAFDIWNSNLEDSLHGIGIYSLENAQTTVQDLITYDMLCAFLHTLTDSNPKDAAFAVNTYLSRVCEHALESGDRSLMTLALSNWKQHLREIFALSIPHEYAAPLIKFEKDLGHPVKPHPIEFPLPSEWERPSDFREMSRVAKINSLDSDTRKGALHPRKKRPA